MNSQQTKIRKIYGQKFTGLTDLEWAKIVVSAERHKAIREGNQNDCFSVETSRSVLDLVFAEHVLEIEQVLADSKGGRRVSDDEPEVTVLKGDLLEIADKLKLGFPYAPEHVRNFVGHKARKIHTLAGSEMPESDVEFWRL